MNELATTDLHRADTLMMNPGLMDRLAAFAKDMADANVTIPKHLQGKPADCKAVCLQAMQWRMNPFSVAQKTHITKSGALGYESQLIKAAILSSGKLEEAPEYEFLGDWTKILGRVEEKKSESGGKYYVAAWRPIDEQGLGVRVTAKIRGERAARTMDVLLAQAYPRFSTQWATDPQQQLIYLADRKFARRYMPDVLLGVYTPEELEVVERVDDDLAPPPAAAAPAADSFMPQRRAPAAAPTPAPAPAADAEDAKIVGATPAPAAAGQAEGGDLFGGEPFDAAEPKSPPAAPAPAPTTRAAAAPGPAATRAPAPDDGAAAEDDGELASPGHKARLANWAKSHDKNLDLILAQQRFSLPTLTLTQFNKLMKLIEA